MEKETISLKEAADRLGISKQAVRELMKRKIVDIGIVYPSFATGKTNRYLISRAKFEKFLEDRG